MTLFISGSSEESIANARRNDGEGEWEILHADRIGLLGDRVVRDDPRVSVLVVDGGEVGFGDGVEHIRSCETWRATVSPRITKRNKIGIKEDTK